MPRRPASDPLSYVAPPVSFESLAVTPVSAIFRLNVGNLKSVYASAPDAVKSPTIPRGKDRLLEAIMTMREKLLTDALSHADGAETEPNALDALLEMPRHAVYDLSSSDLPRLVDLMERALLADTTLQPNEFDPENASGCAGVVLARKLGATESALDRAERAAPVRLRDSPPPPPSLAPNPLTDTEITEPFPAKRRKIDFIGGVPLSANDPLRFDSTQGFHPGLWNTQAVTPSQLQQYPSRASSLPTLRVSAIKGPSILKF